MMIGKKQQLNTIVRLTTELDKRAAI